MIRGSTDQTGGVALTGAEGAIGSVLAKFLADQGEKVLALGRQSAPLPSTAWYDPKDPPSALIHLAADSHARGSSDPKALAQPHLDMLRALLAKGWRGHLIFASSAAVYGGSDRPIPEDTPPAPPNAYGAAKLAVEQGFSAIAAKEGLPLTILRAANIYGTAQDLRRRRVTGLLIEAARSGGAFTLFGDGTSQRDYLHVEDFIRAVQAVLRRPPPPGTADLFNIGSGIGTSLAQLITMTERATGRLIHRNYQPTQAEAASSVLDISRAQSRLNWQPQVPLAEGLARLIKVLPDL